MWLQKLQIAVIEKNTEAIESLLNTTPKFDTIEDVEAAMALLKEAARLLYTLKDETVVTMQQLKKNINFLKSTHHSPENKLDIKS